MTANLDIARRMMAGDLLPSATHCNGYGSVILKPFGEYLARPGLSFEEFRVPHANASFHY